MAIVVENLTHIYMKGSPFEKTALRDVNLKIEDGEFVGIIGHTGSGKSTLIQHFNGLLKPTAGRVIVNGMDVSGKNLKELRKHVGVVFQYPEHQLFEETVYKDLSFGMIKMGFPRDKMEDNIKKAIRTVGLDESILQKSPFELSGGQKRRVAIAGILVMEPNILVLDEPAAGLDPGGRDEIYGYIRKLHADTKTTVILVSHNMEDITRLAQRVIVLNEGTVEIDGSVREVFMDVERLERVGLSVPQITHLMRKLKTLSPRINDNVYTVPEAVDELLKHLRKQPDAESAYTDGRMP
jgi:energy-coupling factor transport system ATP-binding protein